MSDEIIKLGNSILQHGQTNNRIYLMKLAMKDTPQIINDLDVIAQQKGYTKIFAKVPSQAKELFIDHHYTIEARIPHFYNGTEEVFFMAKYFSADRQHQSNEQKLADILQEAKDKKPIKEIIPLDHTYCYRKAQWDDAYEMVELYKKVFTSYPFPIYDPVYIQKTMQENIEYFGIWHGKKLVALSSAEKDIDALNAEMTDFAVLSEYRGNQFALYLLKMMEQSLKEKGFKTAYTIARAVSYGMNITFAKMGYCYTGTLINNTNIAGGLESMNVWYKSL